MSNRSWAVLCLCLGISLAAVGCGGSSLNGTIVDSGNGSIHPGSDTTTGSGDAITPEGSASAPAAEICNDGIDNDGNGVTDCSDVACASEAACAPAPVAEVCNDGIDNDGNGVTDCADVACSGSASCLPPPAVAEICDDGVDNDGDGHSDCGDADCAGDSHCVVADPHFDPHALDKYKMVDWRDLIGPGPVCYDCPDPVAGFKDYAVDPAEYQKMNKEYGYRYQAPQTVIGERTSVTKDVKAIEAAQGL